MIYLKDNPLLNEPLKTEHVKHRLLGHWGASPALSFVWVHLNRMIVKHDLDMIFVAGPGPRRTRRAGAGAPRRDLPRSIRTRARTRKGCRSSSSSSPSPATSAATSRQKHQAPSTKAASWLQSLARLRHGARQSRSDRRLRVGDGEAETGPLATAWHSNKFLNPARDGAVLPILNLNGYKIANPTILSRISHEELEALFIGYGYTPYFVEGSDPAVMHQKMAATLERAIGEIRAQQKRARVEHARPSALAHDRAAFPEGVDRAEGDQGTQGRRVLALASGAVLRCAGQSRRT